MSDYGAMDAKAVLEFQLNGSFNLLKSLLAEMTDEEWDARAYPGGNRAGFVVWHCARTLDWALNRVGRSGEEVAEGHAWRDLVPDRAWFGAGTAAEVADALPAAVGRERTAAYLDEVRAAALPWLVALDPEALAQPVDLHAASRGRPEYLEPATWEPIADLDGLPLWQFLARPSVSHIRVHVGELETSLAVIRGRGSA